ncbi:MAG: hypothetical protein RH946_16085 [Rhodospirillales bacterium]
MAEIAAVVAVLVALGAVWLASHANKHVDNSFDKYGKNLAKQVREAQIMFESKTEALESEINSFSRDIENIKQYERDIAEKVHTLTQRVSVLEHDLKNMTEALPPQLLQRRAKGGNR